jgi:hypothetical protein
MSITHRIRTGSHFFMLLGIHFAQFPEMWEVTSTGKLRHEVSSEPLLTDGKFIRGLSGMTCVLPAWSIREVLDLPQLRQMRRSKRSKEKLCFSAMVIRQWLKIGGFATRGTLNRRRNPRLNLTTQSLLLELLEGAIGAERSTTTCA